MYRATFINAGLESLTNSIIINVDTLVEAEIIATKHIEQWIGVNHLTLWHIEDLIYCIKCRELYLGILVIRTVKRGDDYV